MLKRSTRLSYGIGGGVYSVKEAAYAIFILLFYTQVLGLSGSITGVIIAISLLWDGISDPLVGSWSDRLHSRYGRRHPFMVYSTVPMAIGFVGLFSPPELVRESTALLAAWLLFWSLWVRTFITCFAVPHLALSAELSTDYQERSQLLGLRLGVMFLVTLLLPSIGLLLVFREVDGIDGRFVVANYPLYGLMSAGLVALLSFICIMGTRRHVSQPDDSGEDYAPPSLREYIGDVANTFRNKVFRTILSYEIAAAIAWGCSGTLNVLIVTYVFELSPDEMALVLAVPSLIAIPLVWLLMKTLSDRWQKPQLLRFALFGLLLNSLWLLPAKLAGLLPPNDDPLVLVLLLLNNTLFMICFFLRITNSMSIVADITDQHELEEGERKEGGFFSVMTFTLTISTLVGPLYGGVVLDVIGLNKQDLPGEVAEPVLAGLMIAMLIVVIPALMVSLWFARKINISRDEVETIQAALRERQATG